MSTEILQSNPETEMEASISEFGSEEADIQKEVLYHNNSFWWVPLQKNGEYEVPGISKQAKSLKHKQFPDVIFGKCRLSKKLGSVLYPDSLVVPLSWNPKKEIHKETFYSQKRLQWWLNIPWRHVANDGTIRDKDWYICVAANYIPKWSLIMTTLWPGKVYDTWWMKGKRIDIYVNW